MISRQPTDPEDDDLPTPYEAPAAPRMREDLARAVELVRQGMSYGEAAKAVGATRNAVAGACHRAGVKSQYGSTFGKDAAKAFHDRIRAERAALNAAYVPPVPPSRPKPPPPTDPRSEDERDAAMVACRVNGWSFGEIAAHFGVSRNLARGRVTRILQADRKAHAQEKGPAR